MTKTVYVTGCLGFIGIHGLDTSWWESIKASTQDPWEKLVVNDVNGHMKQFKINFKKQ